MAHKAFKVWGAAPARLSSLQEIPGYRQYVVDSRLRYFKPRDAAVRATFAQEVAATLGRIPRSVSPKFLYDARGSDLFERICSLPEYYPTRTEVSILRGIGAGLARHVGPGTRLVELGSGSSVKTRLLLDALGAVQGSTEYMPIDISDILAESSETLLRDYPSLSVTGIIDSYEGGLGFLGRYDSRQSLVAFLGSSLGNFGPGEGGAFLRRVRDSMKPGDLFLVGLDLAKDPSVIERAYNDSEGVTARFNLNVLHRMNAELGADFDASRFAHRASYDAGRKRIEMHVVSLADQEVSVPKAGLRLRLREGEAIHTEYSYKYERAGIGPMLEEAGLEAAESWEDGDGLFSVTLARRPGRT